jgi:hypothetical protein
MPQFDTKWLSPRTINHSVYALQNKQTKNPGHFGGGNSGDVCRGAAFLPLRGDAAAYPAAIESERGLAGFSIPQGYGVKIGAE